MEMSCVACGSSMLLGRSSSRGQSGEKNHIKCFDTKLRLPSFFSTTVKTKHLSMPLKYRHLLF